MRNRPNALDLLTIARRVHADQVLPHVEKAHRYSALMVGNALANAARELEAGSDPLDEELRRLRAIYPHADDAGGPVSALLERYNRQLAVDIRDGRFAADRGLREQVRTHLIQTAIERVRETNPKYLEREGLN